MVDTPLAITLPNRGVLKLTGPDTRSFLQGLISNDVMKVTPEHTIYATMLTPQGKFLYDFFILQQSESLLLETERERIPDLLKRLTMYKLRAQVTIEPQPDLQVIAILNTPNLPATPGETIRAESGSLFADPRHPAFGHRLVASHATMWLKEKNIPQGDVGDYEQHRLKLGIPDSSRDMEPERALLLEYGIDQLNGVDFVKGCYVGQEVTARSKHRATLRKYLHQVREFDGAALPLPGTPVTINNQEIGELRTSLGHIGLAILRWEDVEKAKQSGTPIMADGNRLAVHTPAWLKFEKE